MAQWVVERPPRMVAHGHADMTLVGGEIEIIFPVLLHAVWRPSTMFCPARLFKGLENDAFVLEGLEIGGDITMVVVHVETLSMVPVVAGIKVERVAKYMGRGVCGIHVGDNGVAAQRMMFDWLSASA